MRSNLHKNISLVLFMTCCQLSSCRDESSEREKAAPETPSAANSSTNVPPLSNLDASNNSTPNVPKTDRGRIAESIAETIGVMPTGDLSETQWKIVKSRYWLRSFDLTIHKYIAGEPPTVNSLLEQTSPEKPFALQLASGKFASSIAPEEQEALLALHSLAMICAANGGHSLPLAVNSLESGSDLTQGDVFVFETFKDAFAEVTNKREVAPSDFQKWVNMAKSRNPLQRLLVLQTFRKVSTNNDQWLDLYQNYIEEKDQTILNELVVQLFESGRPEASGILTSLQANPEVNASPSLNARVKRTQQMLEKYHPSR